MADQALWCIFQRIPESIEILCTSVLSPSLLNWLPSCQCQYVQCLCEMCMCFRCQKKFSFQGYSKTHPREWVEPQQTTTSCCGTPWYSGEFNWSPKISQQSPRIVRAWEGEHAQMSSGFNCNWQVVPDWGQRMVERLPCTPQCSRERLWNLIWYRNKRTKELVNMKWCNDPGKCCQLSQQTSQWHCPLEFARILTKSVNDNFLAPTSCFVDCHAIGSTQDTALQSGYLTRVEWFARHMGCFVPTTYISQWQANCMVGSFLNFLWETILSCSMNLRFPFSQPTRHPVRRWYLQAHNRIHRRIPEQTSYCAICVKNVSSKW